MVDPFEPPPSDAGPPPAPPEPGLPVGWIAATVVMLGIAVVVLIVVLTTGGDEPDPSAATDQVTSTSETAAFDTGDPTAAEPPATAPVVTGGTTPPSTEEDPGTPDVTAPDTTVDPEGGGLDPPEADPEGGEGDVETAEFVFAWPDPSFRVGSSELGMMQTIELLWNDAAGESAYRLSLGRGAIVIDLPADTTRHEYGFSCDEPPMLGYALQAIGADGGVLREIEYAGVMLIGCPPHDLRARAEGAGVEFLWERNGSFAVQYQVSTAGEMVGEDIGWLDPPGAGTFWVEAYCGTTVGFTLASFIGDGVEVHRESVSFDTEPCPEIMVVAGPRVTVSGGGARTATASCPAGWAALSGGHRVWPDAFALPLPGWISESTGLTGSWSAEVTAPPERDLMVQAYVVCIEGETVAAWISDIGFDLGPNRFDSEVLDCASATVTGGGFVTRAGVQVLVSAPDENGWRVSAFNPLDDPARVFVTVHCLRTLNAEVIEVTRTGSVADGEVGPGDLGLACPAGSRLVGAGFASPDGHFEASYPVESGGAIRWVVEARNQDWATDGDVAIPVSVTGLCLRIP